MCYFIAKLGHCLFCSYTDWIEYAFPLSGNTILSQLFYRPSGSPSRLNEASSSQLDSDFITPGQMFALFYISYPNEQSVIYTNSDLWDKSVTFLKFRGESLFSIRIGRFPIIQNSYTVCFRVNTFQHRRKEVTINIRLWWNLPFPKGVIVHSVCHTSLLLLWSFSSASIKQNHWM